MQQRLPAVAIKLYHRVVQSLWFAPMLYVVGGMLLISLIVGIGPFLPEAVLRQLPPSDPETIRGVLELLASSTLTVATVTFSVLMVVLNMTASNFSPRALAGYMRDRINQNTLGVFLGGFGFAATGMLVSRLGSQDDRFLGLLLVAAVTVAFATLAALVYFIHHTASEVQITNLIVRMYREADKALTRFLESANGEQEPAAARAALPSEPCAEITSTSAGYIQVLDYHRLLELARTTNLRLRIVRHTGDFVARGSALLEMWPPHELTPDLTDDLRSAYAIGAQRTAEADPMLGIELLTEVAVRALSPGINDPNTAVNCLHYLGDLLSRLSGRELPRGLLYDKHGILRVVVATPDFRTFLERPLLAIARAGADKLRVILTMLEVLSQLAEAADRPERRSIIADTAEAVVDLALSRLSLEQERKPIQQAIGSIRRAVKTAAAVPASRA